MAQMIKGQDSLVLIRKCYEAVDADKYMYMTEWEVSVERDSDSESTFEGSYNKGGSLENTFSGTAKLAKGDKTARTIFNAIQDDVRYELWICDRLVENPEVEGEFELYYGQGYFNKFSETGEVDEVIEYESEFAIEGKIKLGFAALPEAVKQAVSDYLFHKPVQADPALEVEPIAPPTA